MAEKKIKVMTLGDIPLGMSGVGIQSRYFIEFLLKTGKFQVVSLGGAMKHPHHNPTKTEEYGDDWVIYPVDGFGNQQLVRSFIRKERPDILWFMTDPRFWGWLWEIESEIRPVIPMVYYHVWDNLPSPKYNVFNYSSNDVIVSISKVTNEAVRGVAPDVELRHITHCVDLDVFKKLSKTKVEELKSKNFPKWDNDKFLFLWINRNARRKMPGTLIWWFKEFLDEIGHDKASLIMHTDPKDENGPDLETIIRDLGITNGQVMFSTEKLFPQDMAMMHNIADCIINISDAEGFGLSTLEALACETPIIVNMTGGLQEQVTDGKNWFGYGIEPSSKSIVGSQEVPYIFEDRISKKDFHDALRKMYNASEKEREKMGHLGRQHVLKNYNPEVIGKKWVALMLEIYEKRGSWDTRKNYKSWSMKEVA